jgi:O-antigen/teichoic acid export membrane protein
MKVNLSLIKSIVGSIIFKLGTAIISFIAVPLLLHTLGTDDYGLWVTLTALVSWLNLFDFGSGYSLKNKVTESLVNPATSEINVLIAGTLQFYFISTLIILLAFVGCLFFLEAFNNNVGLTCILYLPVILTFPLTVGHFIIQGLKKFTIFNSLLLCQSGLWLIIILLFKFKFLTADLYKLAAFYSLLYVVVNSVILITSLQALHFKSREILNFNHLRASKSSLLVGGNFFLLQVCSLVLFSLGNIMTYNNLTLKDVAQFDTVNKIFLMGMMLFNVLISIFWAEISQAKALNDQQKLNKIYKELMIIATLFSVASIGFCFLIPYVVTIWTKGAISITTYQLVPFVTLACIQAFSYVGAVFLNAFEDIKGQVIFSVVSALLIIPFAKYFFYINLGIGSVPLASAIVCTPGLFYLVIKSKKSIDSII